jgi:diaminopimelate dehydrogenase
MKHKIRIGIVGYGNVGKGVELSVEQNHDMSMDVILTRRDPAAITPRSSSTQVLHVDRAKDLVGLLDVVVLCGGSATDLVVQGPHFAQYFNVVDSFDTHAKIPEYFATVDAAARRGKTVAVISTGWDPGLFSLLRVVQGACLPFGTAYTFWGPGISQGHSDAVRRVQGVIDGRQYTLPIDKALNAVRSGGNPSLSAREKHRRLCYIVLEKDTPEERQRVEAEIRNMPNYFADYDTTVNFVTQEELQEEHSQMPHGGFVLTSGESGSGHKHVMEFSLKLESNPEFTGSVLTAYARAAYKLSSEGAVGAQTVFDIAPKYLSMKSNEELRKTML